MSELTNATMMNLTQTSTKIPQKINIPRSITKMNGFTSIMLHWLLVSSLLLPFSSLYKHMQ